MYSTTTAWLALDSAGGPFAVGLVLAARMLPSLLFGLAAGTLADRVQRNRLLVGVSLTAVPLMLALSGLAEETVADLLDALVAKQLLARDDDPRSPERGQYSFLQGLVRTVAPGWLPSPRRSAA